MWTHTAVAFKRRHTVDTDPTRASFPLIKCIPEHIVCNDNMHFVSTPHVLQLSQALIAAQPPRGQEYRLRADEVTWWMYQWFALDLMSGNSSGGIGRSLIYRDAITFINACLIKGLPCFNLILPLANYHHTHTQVGCCPHSV